MTLNADLLRGYTDSIILQQLADSDSYGYRINKNVNELSGGQLELKEATLYTAFKRLETAGYIRSYWGDEGSGARRRYYSITGEGRRHLSGEKEIWKETKALISLLLGGENQ